MSLGYNKIIWSAASQGNIKYQPRAVVGLTEVCSRTLLLGIFSLFWLIRRNYCEYRFETCTHDKPKECPRRIYYFILRTVAAQQVPFPESPSSPCIFMKVTNSFLAFCWLIHSSTEAFSCIKKATCHWATINLVWSVADLGNVKGQLYITIGRMYNVLERQ